MKRRAMLAGIAVLSLLLSGAYAFVLVASGHQALVRPTSEFSGIQVFVIGAMAAALCALSAAPLVTVHAAAHDDAGVAALLRDLGVAALMLIGAALALRVLVRGEARYRFHGGHQLLVSVLLSLTALAVGLTRTRRGLRRRSGIGPA